MQKDWIPQEMPRAVARPREAVTQPVGCPLSVSPAGAVWCGGLSPWPRSAVPNRWSRWSPNPGPPGATGSCRANWSGLPKSRFRNRRPLDELDRAPNPLRHRHQPVMPEHAAFPVVIQSFCITPILAFFNSFWWLSRHLSRLDNHQKLLHDNEGSG
jgi:hypothetical protein